jgi:bifunctional enzyme CysN/CysC
MAALAQAFAPEAPPNRRPPRAPVGVPAAGAPSSAPLHLADSLHVLTCGSVDDGKSTLIGRLLWDAGALHSDQRETLQRSPRTAAGTPDFSLLVDGLVAEREQGITIDVAWRYFDTPARRLVIIDSPGHVQYTRNMATGASHADLAILLVDARSGVKAQTRRHAAILDLMHVEHVVLAVNKMDLAGWSQARFRAIEADFQALAARFGFRDAVAVPVSAVLGDNIARRSAAMPWYDGPLLLEYLQRIEPGRERAGAYFRFPVQMVVRAGQDFRGLAGTVASGTIAVGDEVADPVSGRQARVRRIVTLGRDLPRASAGQAVVLQLDADIDVSRGSVLAPSDHAPPAARSLDARLVWLADEPFSATRGYLLRTATDLVPVATLGVSAHMDLEQLAERPAATLAANDIAAVRIDLGRASLLEPFAEQPATGRFLLIDAVTGATVAGGVVTAVRTRSGGQGAEPEGGFRLTRALLRQGVAADLGHDPASEEELQRRAAEVAILLRRAGVAVELEDRLGHARMTAALWPGLLLTLSFGLVWAVVLGML